jgi:hypothetical protein
MDKSFELLGAYGNKLVHMPLINRSQTGNDDGFVWWVKKPDGSYDYDFTVFDRYLELVKKHCGPQEFVVCHVFVCQAWTVNRADIERFVTCVDPATGKHEPLRVPVYGTEECKAFWKTALLAVKQHLAKLGMEKAMALGNVGDIAPPPDVVKMFSEIVPDAGWWRACHSGSDSPKPYPLKGGGLVSIHEHCYGMALIDPAKGLPRIWNQRGPAATYLRGDFDYRRPPLLWRQTPENALFMLKRGVGRECIDYWPMNQKSEGGTIWGRWPQSADAHSVPSATFYSQPGPEGALPTVRYEYFREGLQESEALMIISEALDTKADQLGKELADKCRALFLERIEAVRTVRGVARGGDDYAGWQRRSAELYSAVAEVAAKTGGK